MMEIRPFEPEDEDVVVALWEATGLTRPWNDPKADIARKLARQPDLFLVGVEDGEVVATAMCGYDGHRGNINYLAVDPARQGRGLGRQLLTHMESLLLQTGCPKINLQVRLDNDRAVAFYQRCGYDVFHVADLGKRLIPDQ
ncbi:MAG: GNAT family acetyltransferase [Propionibacteriaceae bacterium]|jgi:ribosomal protein S18 acetylase RimI-like enzyme|nr:GNAT family acetyltransferase [Propionibacteriaceae bacterium]